MGQKTSSANSLQITSTSAKQIFKEIKSQIKNLRRELLGIYELKTQKFQSVGEDICIFIDILHLLQTEQSQQQYKNYLMKIAQYIGLTINAREQLTSILQSNVITNNKAILKVQIYLLKLQHSNMMKYSTDYLFQLGKELETLNTETLSTCYSL